LDLRSCKNPERLSGLHTLATPPTNGVALPEGAIDMRLAATLLASFAIVFANAENLEAFEEERKLFTSPHPWIEGFEDIRIGMSKEELLERWPNLGSFFFDEVKESTTSFGGMDVIEPHEPSGAKMLGVMCEVSDSRLVSILFFWEVVEGTVEEQKSVFLGFLLREFGENFHPKVSGSDEKAAPVLTWHANGVLVAAGIGPSRKRLPVGFILRFEGSGTQASIFDSTKDSSFDIDELRELFRQRGMPFNSEELKAMAKPEQAPEKE